MTQNLRKGDRVTWNAGQGQTTGTIEKQVTKETQVNGNPVAASESDPRYLVKNDSTGKVTAHKPETLEKVSHAGDKGELEEEKQQTISPFLIPKPDKLSLNARAAIFS